MRLFPIVVALTGILMVVGVSTEAQNSSASSTEGNSRLIEDLVAANRILADLAILDGYGHVSVRGTASPNRFLMSRSLAPELVTAADVMEYDLESNPVDARGRATYRERFIHGEIYKARPDVRAIVHTHAPPLIPFGATSVALQPLYHMSAFIGQGVPVFDIRKAAGMTDMLVTSSALGQALAQALGDKPAALMRGHGAVVVGSSLPIAVGRSFYLKINAELQTQAATLGGKIEYLAAEEVRKVGTPDDYQRPWELWKRKAATKN